MNLFVMLFIFILVCFLIKKVSIPIISKSIISVYVVISFGILFSTKINLFELYPVKDITYIYIILGISSIVLGYVLYTKYMTNRMSDSLNELQDCGNNTLKFNSKFLNIIQIALALVLTVYAVEYYGLLNEYGVEFARTIRFEVGYLFSSSIEAILYSWIISPLVSFAAIILAYKLVHLNLKDKMLYVYALNIFLYFQIGLGRFIIFELFIYYLIILLASFKNAKVFSLESLKTYKNLAFAGLGAIVLGLYISYLRLGMDNLKIETISRLFDKFITQLFVYFEGAVHAFDHGLETFFQTFGPTYGRLTFAGLDELIGYPLSFLGFNYEVINSQIGVLTNEMFMIGPVESYNAFYTGFMNFYIDFGVFGLIGFGMLFGSFVAFIVLNYIKKKNPTSLILLAYVSYTLILTVLKWEYQFANTWIFFILILLIHKHLNNQDEINSSNLSKEDEDN